MSLFLYADIGPHALLGHQRRVVAMVPVTILARNPHRQWWEMDGLLPHLELLAARVSNEGS